ncbi:MAG: c-type cytochrome biogenesis protein CcsB [Dehalococcoidia bacterium]|jgi:cytochrome c-type biogenesis protein CcsB
MDVLESVFLIASLVCVALTLLLTIVVSVRSRKTPDTGEQSRSVSGLTVAILTYLSLVLVTLTIIFRTIQTGHGPFSNMYEFALAFSWGIILMGIIFEMRYKTAAAKNIGLFIAVLLLVFATVQHAKPAPLIPALQQSVLLSVHVAAAVVAYGAFTVGFGAASLFLVQYYRPTSWLPDKPILDSMSNLSVVIGFPFLTLTIILGALWADIAWGRYWGWDPKETASLVTWLLFAAYLHARIIRGWRDRNAAILIIIGFAAVLLTFFGNYIFSGLHAYR